MQLGVASIGLAVKDPGVAIAYREQPGFRPFGRAPAQNRATLGNGDVSIGRFRGRSERSMLTFDPGRSEAANEGNPFIDVREIRQRLESAGAPLRARADAATTLAEPDGHPVLVDPHR